MLQGSSGRQAKELGRLCDYLAGDGADVTVLSNALLLGLAPPLKARLCARVACYLQDEDEFIDALNQGGRDEVWSILRRLASGVDLFIAASRYYADKMTPVLSPRAPIEVVHGGIAMENYPDPSSCAWPQPPAIGFLSQRCHSKGPDLLAEAFCRLRAEARFAGLKLALPAGRSPRTARWNVRYAAASPWRARWTMLNSCRTWKCPPAPNSSAA